MEVSGAMGKPYVWKRDTYTLSVFHILNIEELKNDLRE